MNVKLSVLSMGVLFFLGQGINAQSKKDTITKEKKIDEVVVQGYRTVTKKTSVTAVTTIKSETLENRPNANVMNIAQGQIAGLNISTGTGQPGAKSSVIIRGVGSFGGSSDPLYVIDGFPSNSDNFRSINSQDIESLDVLKDAAAIAQYGNRGSNGVIVIKTKRGTYGASRFDVRYQATFGVSMLQTDKYNMANARQLLNLENRFGVGYGSTLTQNDIDTYKDNTDWMKYFFRPSVSTGHTLSLTTGGKNLNSYTSVGYYNQDGMLKNTSLQRFSVRNNIDGKSNNEKFKFSVNTAVGFSKNNEAQSLGTGGVNQNFLIGASSGAPYMLPSDYTGSLDLFNAYAASGSMLLTPLFLIDKARTSPNLTDELRFDVGGEASYKLLDDLTARVRTSAEYLTTRLVTSTGPDSFNGLLFSSTQGTPSTQGGNFNGSETINQRREFLFSNLWQLEYRKSFGNHNFEVQGNTEYNNSFTQNNNFTQRGLNPKTFVPDTGAGYVADVSTHDYYVPSVAASKLYLNMISYFGSVAYDYDKKYGVVATARRDGSSRFNTGREWGTFWSVGGFWNVDQEKFMDNVKFVDTWKIRGSIGTTGNQRIVDGTIYAGLQPPKFLDVYTPSSNVYNGGLGYSISFGYPELRWETTKNYNIGTDIEMFSRRLRASFDYYVRKTYDLFTDAPTSPTLGTTSITQNTDYYLYNKGLELNIAYDILKSRDREGWNLTLRGNGSVNNQDINGIVLNDGKISTGTAPVRISQNGYPIYIPFVYHYIGVNSANGNLLFEDINGNATETPTMADRKLAKYSANAKYQGGFGFDLGYKGFFASTTFTFVAGIMRYDYDLSGHMDPDNLGQFNVSSDLLNAWTPTNTNTDIPSLYATNYAYQDQSDRFLKDASYVRLRNAQLGYRLPKRVLEGTFVKDLSIFVQGENLYNWTKWRGYDPESSRASDQYQYPSPKTFTIGVDVKF